MPECTDGEEVVGEINIEHCVVNIVCRYLKWMIEDMYFNRLKCSCLLCKDHSQ